MVRASSLTMAAGAVLFAFGSFAALSWTNAGDLAPTAGLPLATRSKLAHLDEVLRVLEGRPTESLTKEQRARREAVLDALRAYRDAGHFPTNVDEPGRGVPYFIDHEGTRCAMAAVFERTGAAALTWRLALDDNHAYLAAYADDAEFISWLDANGMTLEEVCYVQAPGSIDVPWSGVSGTDPSDPDAFAPGPALDPKPITSGSRPTPRTPDTTGTPAAPTQGKGSALMGKKRGKAANLSVSDWWRRNRAEYLDVRRRYHGTFAATPDAAAGSHRPTPERLANDVLPLFQQLAQDRGEVGSTALVALARATAQTPGGPIVPLALKTLAAEEGRFPEYVALALGISRDPSARMPLRLVLSNGHAGAALVGEVDAVPSRVAAYAALALGQVGDAEDARWLAQCVGDAKRPSDVRSMALLGLAALVERGDPRDGVVAALVPLLHDASLLESVRALIPQVLVKSGDPVAIDAVVRFLAEFKKPLAVRRAAALALGELEVIDGVVARRLLSSSERDPDAATRAYAALALGALGAGAEALDAAQVDALPRAQELALYHRDGIRGQLTQYVDRPWRMLAAALHARRDPTALAPIEAELLAVLTQESDASLREAAALALGLAGAKGAGDALLARLDDEGNPQARALVAEALGLIGETRARLPLQSLLREGSGDLVAYHAAIGLALLADGDSIDLLMRTFETTASDAVRAMLTRALGELGDAASIDRLMAIALDASATERTRARAVAALGMIAEPGSSSWVRSAQRGVDGSQADPIVREVLRLF
jgi:HEAT repeat protein